MNATMASEIPTIISSGVPMVTRSDSIILNLVYKIYGLYKYSDIYYILVEILFK